ncbi:MAG: hypothetical protein ACOYIK_09870 [Coriobacteriales bacterium]
MEQLAESKRMSKSALLRVLAQLPAEAVPEGSQNSYTVVVIDRDSATRIAREMRRWGYHYNQAVHALNRLAYYMQRGEVDYGDATDALADVDKKVHEMNEGVSELRDQVSAITDLYLAKL